MWCDEIKAKCRLEYTISKDEDSKEPLCTSVLEQEFSDNEPPFHNMENALSDCIYRYCDGNDGMFLKVMAYILNDIAEYTGLKKANSECQEAVDVFLDTLKKHYDI